MMQGPLFRVLYAVVRAAMALWHPIFRVEGRENVPTDGKLVICGNHSGMADPFWIIFAAKWDHLPRIMAKKELMNVPVLGWVLEKIGVFGVDRGGNDVQAIKTGLRCLQQEQQLLIFPEGTRCKPGMPRPEPKRGALMLAARTGAPVLPVYVSERRVPFGPIHCVIGPAYNPFPDKVRPDEAALVQATRDLMDRIYEMGEKA